MIEKIKRLYPEHLILVKRHNKIYDLANEEVTDINMVNRYSYVIIDEESYEVHTKISPFKRRKTRKKKI